MSGNNFQLTKEKYQAAMSAIQSFPVLVVGDVGIDRYTQGEATRLNPEAPVPIVSVENIHNKLGLAANVANNLAAFEASPFLSGIVGEDRFSEDFFSMLDDQKINHEAIICSAERRTTVKERVIAMSQQVVRVDHEMRTPIGSELRDKLFTEVERKLPLVKAVIIEDYAKGSITKEVSQRIISLANEQDTFVAVDPPSTSDRARLEFYKGATMMTPNLREAEKLYGSEIHSEADLIDCGNSLMQELECKILVITRGKDGMTIFTPTEKPMHVPTFARKVFDVSGAGDTVIAMLTLAVAAGLSLKESAILANYAAGAGVGVPGRAVVTVPELTEYMEKTSGFSN